MSGMDPTTRAQLLVSLRNLSSDELHKRTDLLVKEECKRGVEIIVHLAEVARRKLFVELGHSGLFT
jgi:hypothetical protein